MGKSLNVKLSPKQLIAYKYLTDKTTYEVYFGGSAGSAKSWLGCVWMLTQCVRYDEVRYLMARKEAKKTKETTLKTLFKAARFYHLYDHFTYNDQKGLVKFKGTNSEIVITDLARDPSDPDYDRLGSLELTSAFLDELPEIPFKAYDVIKTRVGRQSNDRHGILDKILSTSNPSKKWVYSYFYKRLKEGTLPEHIKVVLALPRDNMFLEKGYLRILDNITDDATRARLRDGNWEYDDNPNKLLQYEDILYIFENESLKGGNQYITCDVARFGRDKTVIMYWNGWRVEEIIVIPRGDLESVKKEIEELRSRFNVFKSNVIVDSDGLGAGLQDFGGYMGFVNNARPISTFIGQHKDNFNNLKSQCYFHLADKIRDGKVFVKKYGTSHEVKNSIIAELEQVQRDKSDEDGKVSVIPKKIMKENLGYSPDFSDAMMMRAYFDLKKISGSGYLI